MMPYILILVILTLLWLGAFWRIKRKQNINLLAGFLFFMFLSTFASFLVMLGINYSNRLVYLLVGVIFLFALFVLLFGVYILIAFLLINSVIILRKERFSLSHILTLLVAVGIILLITLSSFLGRINPPLPIMALWSGLIVMILFLTFHIFLFIETLILTNLFHPRKNLNYIIVLGSGLINGNVSPLLAKRIQAALKFAKKQEKKKGFAPYLLMSGGQGSDETRAEALAMKEYAI
ncbi:MAG TPA: YdcF family protein, partial [Thomasclavelia ramosa]|nr:YdcF family protein [Thomasclavelia ramosa]